MRERAKELNCLYQVEELLTKTHLPLAEIFTQIIQTIPSGLPVPRDLPGQDRLRRHDLPEPGLQDPSNRTQSADIKVEDKVDRPHRGLLYQRSPADRKQLFSQGRAQAAQHHRRAHRPDHPASEAGTGVARMGNRPKGPQREEQEGMDGDRRPAAAHRPEPVHPSRPQNGLPSVLERRRWKPRNC